MEAARLGQYSNANKRSSSYSRQMQKIEERSQRHSEQRNFEHIFSSDISALKKLQLVEERNSEARSRSKLIQQPSTGYLPPKKDQKPSLSKPTASE